MVKPVLLLAASAAACGAARSCKELTVKVSIAADNAVFDLDPLTSEIDTTDFFLKLSRQGTNYYEDLFKGEREVKGTYSLAATYCEPKAGPGHTLQILTHGVGFDRSYWDLPFNKHNYSYVNQAVDAGYSTLTWDRLGVGHSSKGDTISEIQINLEIAALKALTEKAAHGDIRSGKKFTSIVHGGHSFGSAMTYALANSYPELTQGIMLQGFSQAPGYLNYFALGGNFVPVSSIKTLKTYPRGYLGVQTRVGIQTNFFAPGNFDPKMLDRAYDKQVAFTPAELLTVAAPVGKPNNYNGPVLIVTGDNDVPFCGGNCLGTSAIDGAAPNLIEFSRQFFKKASKFNATIIPGTGHGMNMEYSHPLTFATMLDFLDQNL